MQHLGDNVTRCIAMSSTDGLTRGMEAEDTGSSIKVPVGDATLGRVFNVLGKTVDHDDTPVNNKEFGLFIVLLQNLMNKKHLLRFWKQVSK